MKRKLLIMLVIFTLLFSNFAFAAGYNYNKSESDKYLKDVAKIADSEDTYIGTQYTAQSMAVDSQTGVLFFNDKRNFLTAGINDVEKALKEKNLI